MTSALVALFNESWQDHAFPDGCSITRARADDQDDLADVVEAVTQAGGRADLVSRLRATHPVGSTHRQQHDDRLWDVLAEAVAFAWAASLDIGDPCFCPPNAHPDLEVPGRCWIEVKSIHLSDAEWATVREGIERGGGTLIRTGWLAQEPHPTLLKKLGDAWDKALEQFQRVDSAGDRPGIVWLRVGGFDWPLSPRAAWQRVIEWADDVTRDSPHGLVVVPAWNWLNPKFVRLPIW